MDRSLDARMGPAGRLVLSNTVGMERVPREEVDPPPHHTTPSKPLGCKRKKTKKKRELRARANVRSSSCVVVLHTRLELVTSGLHLR